MKKVLVYGCVLALATMACNAPKNEQQAEEAQWSTFGEVFEAENVIDANLLAAALDGQDSIEVAASGIVEKTCKMKGCWMTVKMDDGSTMRVTFKDYGFFVPKNAENVEAVFTGIAKVKTTSVEDLKHFAEDAGKTEEEIATITEPKTELVFVATGVKMKAPAEVEENVTEEKNEQAEPADAQAE